MLLREAYRLYIDEYAVGYYNKAEVGYHIFNMKTWDCFKPDLEADAVTPQLFIEWRAKLAEGSVRTGWGEKRPQSRARTTVNRNHQTFMRAMTWLMTMRHVSTETHYRLAHVPQFKQDRGQAKEPVQKPPLDDNNLDAVIAHCPNESFRELLMLMRLSGMRPEEAASLRKEDVDKTPFEQHGVWIYCPQKHKTKYMGKGRVITFGPKCQEIIKRFEAKKRLEDGPLFRNDRGTAWTVINIYHRIQSICKKHKIPAWHTSQLRKARSNEVFSKYGLEAEEATLGHTQEIARKYYLLRDIRRASEVAREIG